MIGRTPNRWTTILCIAVAVLLTTSTGASAAPKGSGTDYIEVFYPGWGDNQLTVALVAGKSVQDFYRQAVYDAIAEWNANVGGWVTYINVTGNKNQAAQADVKITLTSGNTGGVVFGGRALCSAPGCHQVLTSTVNELYDYDLVYGTTLHELGHVIGLGHGQPIETSWDIMGYGWIIEYDGTIPGISRCDREAVAVVWAWVAAGTGPQPPATTEVAC
jgi:hypothetical protein